jgi:hypothetical protein
VNKNAVLDLPLFTRIANESPQVEAAQYSTVNWIAAVDLIWTGNTWLTREYVAAPRICGRPGRVWFLGGFGSQDCKGQKSNL